MRTWQHPQIFVSYHHGYQSYKRLSGIEFQNNMNEDKTAMFFKTEQLKGCSKDFVKGKYWYEYYFKLILLKVKIILENKLTISWIHNFVFTAKSDKKCT